MGARTVPNPFQVNHLAGMVLRGVGADVEVFVGDEVSVGAPSVATWAKRFGLAGGGIVDVATEGEERAYAVSEPQRGEDVCHLFGPAPREVAFGIDEGDICGDAVGAPDF